MSKLFFSNITLFLGTLVFSLVLTYGFNYFIKSKIEYKFINSLNEERYEFSLNFVCEESVSKLNKYENIYPKEKREYYKILELIDEKEKNTSIRNFKILRIFLLSPNRKDQDSIYGVSFSYELVYDEFNIRLTRAIEKKLFVKKINEKSYCINF